MKISIVATIIIFMLFYQNSDGQALLSNIFSQKFQILGNILLRALTPSSENPRNLRLAEELHCSFYCVNPWLFIRSRGYTGLHDTMGIPYPILGLENSFLCNNQYQKLSEQEFLESVLQPKLNDYVPFPCPLNNARSRARPSSVHALRPGDIDVVAAIGDSLTAGNGLVATNVLQVFVQNRGLSASIGGQGNWRQYLTLPNILKEFNPQLIGYSTKDFINNTNNNIEGLALNVASPSARSSDTPAMTEELVRRIKSDYRINFETDWKLVTVLIGGNDFCNEMCQKKNPEIIIERHRNDLTQMLRILRDNLPRTLVNVVLTPNLMFLTRTTDRNKPLLCYVTQPYLCPCLFSYRFQNQRKRFNQIMLKWQNAEVDVVNNPEFDRNDFTVLALPFLSNYGLPRTKEGLTDYTFLSQDCFHVSQKGGARAANSLWNNLLEPVGRKSTTSSTLFNFICPTNEHPYIFTRRNSIT